MKPIKGKEPQQGQVRGTEAKKPSPARPEIYEKAQKAAGLARGKTIALTDRDTKMIKDFQKGKRTDEANLEMKNFLVDTTGNKLKGIHPEGLKQISQFLLTSNNIAIINLVLDQVMPRDVEGVFKLLNEHPELLKDIKILKIILSSVDPVGVMKAVLENENLRDMEHETFQMIVAFKKPVEILNALDAKILVLDPKILKRILISDKPLEIIELIKHYPVLINLKYNEFNKILNDEKRNPIINLMGKAAIMEDVNPDVVETTLFRLKNPEQAGAVLHQIIAIQRTHRDIQSQKKESEK